MSSLLLCGGSGTPPRLFPGPGSQSRPGLPRVDGQRHVRGAGAAQVQDRQANPVRGQAVWLPRENCLEKVKVRFLDISFVESA